MRGTFRGVSFSYRSGEERYSLLLSLYCSERDLVSLHGRWQRSLAALRDRPDAPSEVH
jgi:hypothetical protein